MRLFLAGSFLVATVGLVQAADYKKVSDDFSNGFEHTITFQDVGSKATLLVRCTDENKSFWVSIYINDVIFPDDIGDDFMYLNMTHKFDTAASAHKGR